MTHFTHRDSILVAASPETIWAALVDPELGARWRGARIDTDWRPGSPLVLEALIGTKATRDKGRVLRAEPPRVLAYEFLPKVSTLPDVPESYSVITMTLSPDGVGTRVAVEHRVPPSPLRRGKGWEIGPESGIRHVEFYWRTTLPLLRDLVEGRPNLTLG